jgi:hypothetical protein
MGNKAHYWMIRESVEAIDRYVQTGCHPGDFLYAVITNNLKESFGRADSHNRENLFSIVRYLYNEVPSPAWGSVEKVQEWSRDRMAAIKAEKERSK